MSCRDLRRRLLLAAGLGLASIAPITAQSSWSTLNPASGPGYRAAAAAASGFNTVWMFGGASTAGFYADTWGWNGLAWTQHALANGPSARASHAMVFDAVRSVVVLFGGTTAAGDVDDTWEWNGASWTQRTPAVRPSARSEHGMAYDMLRNRTVLFGGTTGAGETWEWDGTTWTPIVAAVSPSARRGHGMAYHIGSGRVVLFGGISSSTSGETWEWDGSAWLQRAPVHSPSPRFYFAMSADLARGCVVLFSGRPSYYADTWEWDGDDWHQRLPAASPPARSGAVFATDLTQGKPLLFGGNRVSPSLQWFGGTHLLTAAAPGATPFGGGCAGSAGTPTLGSAPSPFLGSPWSTYVADVPLNAPLFVAIGLSNAAWGTAALPLDLTVLGMTGCDLLVSPDLLLFAPPQAATAVTVPIALPNDALLAGQTIYVQALVLDAAANPFGATLTGAVAAHLALL